MKPHLRKRVKRGREHYGIPATKEERYRRTLFEEKNRLFLDSGSDSLEERDLSSDDEGED